MKKKLLVLGKGKEWLKKHKIAMGAGIGVVCSTVVYLTLEWLKKPKLACLEFLGSHDLTDEESEKFQGCCNIITLDRFGKEHYPLSIMYKHKEDDQTLKDIKDEIDTILYPGD